MDDMQDGTESRSPERLEKEESTEELLNQIQQVVPGAFSEGKFDSTKLAQILGQEELPDERYEFRWAGKQGALNEARRAPRQTLQPDHERSLNFERTENVLIEGENLEAMKALQKAYHRRVKMIYIDPPYNTGNDFIYDDDYRMGTEEYEELTKQRDTEGNRMVLNPETGGQYHSNWLSMMYPRLFLARSLLRDDGAIFVSIDHHEYHNLRKVMDEIFGEDNHVSTISWRRKKETANDNREFATKAEHLLVYGRSEFVPNRVPLDEEYVEKNYIHEDKNGRWRPAPIAATSGHQSGGYSYSVKTPAGRVVEREWLYPQERFEEMRENGRIYFGKEGDAIPNRKHYLKDSEGVPPDNLWLEKGTNKEGKKEVESLLGGHVDGITPKPVALVEYMLETAVSEGDIVMDFFAGTGTTGQAVMQHNADEEYDDPVSYILVQLDKVLDDPHDEFDTLSELCRQRLELAAEQFNSSETTDIDCGFKMFRLSASNFPRWQPTVGAEDTKQAIQSTLEQEHVDIVNADAALTEVMLTEGFSLNATVDRDPRGGDDHWIEVTEDGHNVYISLAENLPAEAVEDIAPSADTPLICLDSALSDTQKNNIAREYTLKTV